MAEFKKIPTPNLDELGLSDEDLASVAGGGAGQIVGDDDTTVIVVVIVVESPNG